MKPIGVLYATREGHTERIAERISTRLHNRGFEIRIHNVRSLANFAMDRYEAVILAASVHAGKHEREMVNFVKQHRNELERLPAAFLSITLSAAGVERTDTTPDQHARFVADVNTMLDHFFEQTGWHPDLVKPVAGALLYSKYNVLVRFVMKWIAKKAGAETDTSRDYEYTDWAALDRFVDEFADRVCPAAFQPVPDDEHMPMCRR
jgi:menaquinone-dependent protoporphyrinogen oxidase